MSRTAPLATALLSLLALGASPAHAFGSVFSPKKFTVSIAGLSLQEWQCNDGIDNDGDGDIDSLDSDCDDLGSVPTIDLGGSANPGGDDVMPIPFFFLALDDTGADLGLYALTSERTDAKGNTTYAYDVVVSGLAALDRYGYLEEMTAGIADTDDDGYDDVVLAMPKYGNGLVMSYTDVAAGEQSFSDYAGYLYTDYSSYSCASGSSTCTSNVAEGLLIDSDRNTLLVDLGYGDYYGEGQGFYWAVDATSLRSRVAEDGGLVYGDVKSGYFYYYN
jgi:hypothetical protein